MSQPTRTRRLLLTGAAALAAVIAPILISAPANAALEEDHRSSAPTTTVTRTLARGATIRVSVNAHESKILARTTTVWLSGHRIYDWSPQPGTYTVKSIVRWQTRIFEYGDVWVPDGDCADYSTDGYDGDDDGYFDGWDDEYPYDACAEDGQGVWDTVDRARLGAQHTTTRYNTVTISTDETPGCVSRSEWGAAKPGMTRTRVHSIFGTSGTHSDGWGSNNEIDEYRHYRSCPSFGGHLSINYDNYSHAGSGLRVYSKDRSYSW
jgi:hypothetical protein